MKVEVVKVERLYNLGDYESLRVGYEAVLTEIEGANSQEVLNVTANLEKLCDQYYEMGRFQRQPQEKPKPEEKKPQGIVVNLENIAWEEQPATEKGPWEKSMSQPIDYFTVKKTIEDKQAAGKAGFVTMEGYLIWLNSDGSLGRRKK